MKSKDMVGKTVVHWDSRRALVQSFEADWLKVRVIEQDGERRFYHDRWSVEDVACIEPQIEPFKVPLTPEEVYGVSPLAELRPLLTAGSRYGKTMLANALTMAEIERMNKADLAERPDEKAVVVKDGEVKIEPVKTLVEEHKVAAAIAKEIQKAIIDNDDQLIEHFKKWALPLSGMGKWQLPLSPSPHTIPTEAQVEQFEKFKERHVNKTNGDYGPSPLASFFETWALPIVAARVPKFPEPPKKPGGFNCRHVVGEYTAEVGEPKMIGDLALPEQEVGMEPEIEVGDKVVHCGAELGVGKVIKLGTYLQKPSARVRWPDGSEGWSALKRLRHAEQKKEGLLYPVGAKVRHKRYSEFGVGVIKKLRRLQRHETEVRGAEVVWEGDGRPVASALTDLIVVTDDIEDQENHHDRLTHLMQKYDTDRVRHRRTGRMGRVVFIHDDEVQVCVRTGKHDRWPLEDTEVVSPTAEKIDYEYTAPLLPGDRAGDHGYKDGTFLPRATNKPRRLGKVVRKIPGDDWEW